MSLDQQQVNVQDLQRLNEAIVLVIDAMRRVAPQLGQVQAVLANITAQQQQQPFIGSPGTQWGSQWGWPAQTPVYGSPFFTPQFNAQNPYRPY